MSPRGNQSECAGKSAPDSIPGTIDDLGVCAVGFVHSMVAVGGRCERSIGVANLTSQSFLNVMFERFVSNHLGDFWMLRKQFGLPLGHRGAIVKDSAARPGISS